MIYVYIPRKIHSFLFPTAHCSHGLKWSPFSILQANLAVLLTSSYGVIAAQFKLLDGQLATSISKIFVRMFLPALLVTKVGGELHLDTAVRYVPVLGRS
jgi:auxin efflux carrier family protein